VLVRWDDITDGGGKTGATPSHFDPSGMLNKDSLPVLLAVAGLSHLSLPYFEDIHSLLTISLCPELLVLRATVAVTKAAAPRPLFILHTYNILLNRAPVSTGYAFTYWHTKKNNQRLKRIDRVSDQVKC
jgi:hypothetical protein